MQSHHPKLIYTVSTLQNPTGITTSFQHRQQLLALAEKYGCLILEDNAYEGLNFEPVPPPIKSLDSNDSVIYTGTFSKTLMPGLRVGYLLATGKHYRPLLEQKLFHDLHVSTVSQAIVSEYLASGYHRRHLNHLQASNLTNRNAMLQALANYFPVEATWTIPNGGLFLWGATSRRNFSDCDRTSGMVRKSLCLLWDAIFSRGKKVTMPYVLIFPTPQKPLIAVWQFWGKLLKQYLAKVN